MFTRIVGQYVIVLVTTLSINFALPRIAPGDPINYLVGEDTAASLTQAEQDRVLQEFGLDKPIPQQFVDYVTGIFRGDLGTSVLLGSPVWEVVFAALGWSLLLMSAALFLSAILGTVLGVLSAWKRGEQFDIGALATVLFLGSMPPFWVAMLLITLFAANLGWLPSFGAYELGTSPGSLAYLIGIGERMIMPVVALTLVQTANILLTARYSMSMALDQDYIVFARAKGVPERRVFFGHAFRNAVLPVYTNVMMGVGNLVGGALVIETVFAYPGLGSLIVEGVEARDYNLLQGIFLLTTLAVVLTNLIADLTYPFLDPRVRRTA